MSGPFGLSLPGDTAMPFASGRAGAAVERLSPPATRAET
jgi:hypothetical protein